MIRVTFCVPGPPVPWERSSGAGKRRFTSPRTRAYQAHVRQCAYYAMIAAHLRTPWDGPCRVLRRFYLPDARRRDEDNLVKSINDAGNRMVWADDSWIKSSSTEVFLDRKRPRVEVEVELHHELNGWISPSRAAALKASDRASRSRKSATPPAP